MAPAVASLVSGLALLTATIRLGSTRRIGAITADVTARIGDGSLLADSARLQRWALSVGEAAVDAGLG